MCTIFAVYLEDLGFKSTSGDHFSSFLFFFQKLPVQYLKSGFRSSFFTDYYFITHETDLRFYTACINDGFDNINKLKGKGKGKAVPLQAWSGPQGSRKLRFPDFITTAQDGGKVFSLTHRPPLHSRNVPGTHFCLGLV